MLLISCDFELSSNGINKPMKLEIKHPTIISPAPGNGEAHYNEEICGANGSILRRTYRVEATF
jgi:hypothetical protein